MSSFLIFNDGRAWVGSDQAFDAVITALAQCIHVTHGPSDLGDWLLSQQTALLGMGMGAIDLRELTPVNQEIVVRALDQVLNTAYMRHDLRPWHDAIDLLRRMFNAFRHGEPPRELNPHLRSLLPASGRRAGPGW